MTSKSSKNNDGTYAILWDRSFVFLSLSFFLLFTNVAFFCLYPLALEEMGIALNVVGLVLGTFSLAAVLSRPFLGKLVIQKGEFPILSLGLATCFLSSMSYCLITQFGPAMLFIRVLHGLGFSAFIAATFSLAAKAVHPQRRGEAFSIIGVSLMAAVAFAPYFGEFLIREWGFFAVYIAASGVVVPAWLAAFLSIRPLFVSVQDIKKAPVKYSKIIKNRSFVFLLISTVIFSHCQATVPQFLELIAHEKGVSGGRYFLFSNLMAIIILLSTGKLIDRFGKLFFMKLSYPLLAFGILLIPWMIDSPFYFVSALLYGTGVALLFSAHNALAANYGSRIEKPATMSLFTAIYDSGFVTGTIVSGWFAHIVGLEMLYQACGILAFIGFFVVITLPIRE